MYNINMSKKIKLITILFLLLIFYNVNFLNYFTKYGWQINNNALAATSSVDINNMAFSPDPVTISAGDTVTWTNNDNVTHTTTSDTAGGSEPWNSGNLSNGQSFSHTFNMPGTYTYHCAIHRSMTGTIIVSAADSTSTPTTQPTATPTPQAGAATATPTLTPTPTSTITPTVTILPVTGPGNTFVTLGVVGIIFLIIGGVVFLGLF